MTTTIPKHPITLTPPLDNFITNINIPEYIQGRILIDYDDIKHIVTDPWSQFIYIYLGILFECSPQHGWEKHVVNEVRQWIICTQPTLEDILGENNKKIAFKIMDCLQKTPVTDGESSLRVCQLGALVEEKHGWTLQFPRPKWIPQKEKRFSPGVSHLLQNIEDHFDDFLIHQDRLPHRIRLDQILQLHQWVDQTTPETFETLLEHDTYGPLGLKLLINCIHLK